MNGFFTLRKRDQCQKKETLWKDRLECLKNPSFGRMKPRASLGTSGRGVRESPLFGAPLCDPGFPVWPDISWPRAKQRQTGLCGGKHSLRMSALLGLWVLLCVGNWLGHPKSVHVATEGPRTFILVHQKANIALTSVGQLLGCCPTNRKVASSIPGQGTCLGCGFGP